jgi:hypothetical protein
LSIETPFKKELLKSIPAPLLEKVCTKVETEFGQIPFKCRGIKIKKELIRATLEILNNEPSKRLPQNARNAIAEKTPDGLDKRIKLVLNDNLRTANIISDVLEAVGIVDVIIVKNPPTGRDVNGTQLRETWTW